MKKLHTFVEIVLVIMLVDAACFMFWVMSAQLPTSKVYFGAITSNLIGLMM